MIERHLVKHHGTYVRYCIMTMTMASFTTVSGVENMHHIH